MKKILPYLAFCLLFSGIGAKAQTSQITTGLKTTWVGNSFPGGNKWVQDYIENTKVNADGSINAKCSWDEAGRNNGIYVPCDVVGNQDAGANSRLATDSRGNTWTIVNFYGRFLNYDSIAPIPTGTKAPYIQCSDGRMINSVADPSAIAVDNKGRLLVADNGIDQNIKIFDISSIPLQTGSFGDPGGVYSGVTGMIAPKKLYGIRGMGTDSLGNLWVANSGFPSQAGGTDLRHFDSLGNMNCNLKGLIFVQSADADPGAQTDVYLNNERTHVNYDGAPGDWTFTSESINPFKYPDDPRLSMSMETTWMRRINGQKYMFQLNMYAEFLAVYRFDGEIAVPMAMFTIGWNGQWDKYKWQIDKRPTWDPNAYNSRRWLWVDKNGDGQVSSDEFSVYDIGYPYNTGIAVTANGTVIVGGRHLLSFPANGTDANGVLQYSTGSVTDRPLPAAPDLYDVNRLKYVDSTDMMYIASGGNYPNFNTIYQFANWSAGGTLRRVIRTGLNPGESFTADDKFIYAAGVKNGVYTSLQGEVDIWDAGTGLPVGYLVPGSEVNNQSGWIDLTYGLNTFKRPTGERVLLVEEDWKGKNIIYQWKDHFIPPAIDSLIILAPKDSAAFTYGSPVTFSTYINDGKGDSTIGKLAFYVDGVKVADTANSAYGLYSYTWLNGGAGPHSFFARAFDTAGRQISTSAITHILINYLPDLLPAAITWDPAGVAAGTPVNFKVKVKNIGQGPTPVGVVIGGVFAVDGHNVTWSDTDNTALAPGDSVILSANNGVNGTGNWIASTPGKHTVSFLVDDINRISESNENNNSFSTTVCVAGGGPSISISTPADKDTLYAGNSILVTVDAFKCGGPITSVEYFDGTQKIGQSRTSPFSFTWINAPIGGHSLIARATDGTGVSVYDTANIIVAPLPPYGILRQEWDNINGGTINDLESAPNYPGRPDHTSMVTSLFEGPVNTGVNNYGARYSGYITAPQTGNYTFWIASDDQSELWLSNNGDSAGKQKIAWVADWTNSRVWTASPSQQSVPISLVAGQRYYIEALYKQGGGGDNLAVGWTLPDSSEEKPIPAQRIVPFNIPSVQSFTLTNADGSKDIRQLKDKDTINLASMTNWFLNVRANTAPSVTGSVVFVLDNIKIRTDNYTPYTLYDRAYFPVLPGKTYTLTATPYLLAGGKGQAGQPKTITVKAIFVHPGGVFFGDGKGKDPGRGLLSGNDRFELYPNPAGSNGNRVTVSFFLPVNEKVELQVVNNMGQIVQTQSMAGYEGSNTGSLDTGKLLPGIYYVNLVTANARKSKQLLIIR
ncbi:Ig-like domain-containing protein [Flavitalea flava]